MYKNLIGLERLKQKKNNQKRLDNRSYTLSDNAVQINESKSEASFNIYAENDHDETADEYYHSNLNNDIFNEEYDDDDDDEFYDFEPTNNLSGNYAEEVEEFNKNNRSIRLDLMNEIKDEIFDDSSLKSDSASTNYLAEEENDENDDQDYESEVENINLNSLRICIDEIEELTDKSNKTCFVFVIQVWNIQQEPTSDLSPNWYVKRKYDEFYVLDTKLREFHGGNLNPDLELPNKQRALFFVSNSRNLEYLNSIKNDFAKYTQVFKLSNESLIFNGNQP
jgi:hypothetical protein